MSASCPIRPRASASLRLAPLAIAAFLAGLIALPGLGQALVIDPLTGELVDKLPPQPLPLAAPRQLVVPRAAVPGGLYGSDGANLFLINKTTGAPSLIGSHNIPTGEFAIGSLAFTSNGELWGTSLGATAKLYRINTMTGAATAIGSGLGLPFIVEGGLEFVCDSAHGANELDLTTGEMKSFRANTATGVGTRIGPAEEQMRDLNGLAYDGTVLWGIDRRSDTIGKVDFRSGEYIESTAIPVKVGGVPIMIGNTGGLAADPADGTIYMEIAGSGAPGIAGLYTINPTTGNAVLKGANNVRYGLAFAPIPTPTPAPATPTPTPSPSPTPTAPLDHFVLYKIKTTKNTQKLPAFGPLTLKDAVGNAQTGFQYDVKRIRRLGAPADKEGEGINDSRTHLVEYQIRAHRGSPKFQGTGGPVIVTDQFDTHTLGVAKPDGILVPTNIDTSSTPAVPTEASHNRDRFLCYKVLGPSVDKTVDVTDGFGTRAYRLTKVSRLCVPVAVSGMPVILSGPAQNTAFPVAPSTIRNRERLVCYSTRGAPRHVKKTGLFLANQVRSQRADTIREFEFCVPTIEPPLPTPTPSPAATPSPTPTAPAPCLTPSPSPIYGSATRAFLAPAATLLD
jgi:hypothetical protein